MKRQICALAAGLLLFGSPVAVGFGARAEAEPELADVGVAELLVEVGDESEIPDSAEVLSSYGDTYLVSFDSAGEAEEALNELDIAGYNVPFTVMDDVVPVDVDVDLEGPVAETALDELAAAMEEMPKSPKARSAKPLTVAVIDTGSETGGVSMLGDDGVDRNGHGTWIAETIKELAPDVEILSIKALDDRGYGDAATVYAALKYAVEQKVDIIHMSFAGYAIEECAPVENLLKEACNMGITIVGAAGNYGADAKSFLPGKVDGVWNIGAADEAGERLSSSNYGSCVDYLVTATSTSEAAALFTGHVAVDGLDIVNSTQGTWIWPVGDDPDDVSDVPVVDGFYAMAPAAKKEGLLAVTNQGYDYLMLGDDLTINPSDFTGTGGWAVENIYMSTGDGPAWGNTVVNRSASYGVAGLGDTTAYQLSGSFSIRFRNAAIDGNGTHYDLIMEVTNIWAKATNAGTGAVALRQENGTVWFGAARLPGDEGLLGLRYDVTYRLVNAGGNTPVQGLMLMAFTDLDQQGIGRGVGGIPQVGYDGTTQGYAFAESIKLNSGVSGNVYLEPDGQTTLKIGDNGFSYLPTAQTNSDNENRSGISFLGDTQGTRFTWAGTSGYTAMTADIAVPSYRLTPYKTGPGTISPASAVTVPAGMGRSFTMTPDANCRIVSITIDKGTAKETDIPVTNENGMTYRFSNVHADHTIHVVFEPKTRTVKTMIRHQKVDGTWTDYSLKDTQTVNYGGNYSYTWVRGSGEPANVYKDATPNPTTATNVTADKTLYMEVPRKQYTYSFDFNPPGSHAVSEITNRQDNLVDKWAETMSGTVKNPALTGYTFLGWNTAKNGTGSAWANEKMLSNKTFYARWKANQYKVHYDGNGSSEPDHLPGEFTQNTVSTASGMPDSTFTYDTVGTLRTNDFVREGYEFIGWNTKADGTGDFYPDKFANVLNWSSTDGAEITLYAQWRKKLGTETLTVVSEETGNPVPGVSLNLYKKVNGSWTLVPGVGTKTTGTDGKVTVSDLHWFDYEWRSVSVPDGYRGMEDVNYTITYNHLSQQDARILYMKHVRLTLDSVVSGIIDGENPPAFLYHVSGTDVAGVDHEYNVLVQTGADGEGSKAAPDMFAGTWNVTQTPVSRYNPENARNVKNSTVSGINGTANLVTNLEAEIRFPYGIRQYGYFGSMDSETNQLRK